MAARKKAAKRPPKKPAGGRPAKPTWEIPTGNFGAKIYVPSEKLASPLEVALAAKFRTGRTKAGTARTKAGTARTKAKSAKTKAKTARPRASRPQDIGKRIRTSSFGAKKRARRK